MRFPDPEYLFQRLQRRFIKSAASVRATSMSLTTHILLLPFIHGDTPVLHQMVISITSALALRLYLRVLLGRWGQVLIRSDPWRKQLLEKKLAGWVNLENSSCSPRWSGGTNVGVEKLRAAVVAAAITGSTTFLDLHSSSAAAPAFAFHTPGAVPEAHAATLPVQYLIEDTTLVGTTIAWAAEQGVASAALLECGQHSSRQAVDVAKRAIMRIVTGAALAPFFNGKALKCSWVLHVSGQCV